MRNILMLACLCMAGCKADHDFYDAQYKELSEACRKSGGVPVGWKNEFGHPHLIRCEVFTNSEKGARP